MSHRVEASAKGSNFLGLLSALERGDPGVTELVLAQLSDELRSSLKFGQLLAMGWYPASWYAELHRAIDQVTQGGPVLARALGRTATLTDFNGLHRFLASVLTVETVFGQAPRLMALYWKGGTIEWLELARGRGSLRFTHWVGFTRLIWEDLMGSMEGILEFCGAKQIRCRTPHEMTGDTVVVEVRWN